MVKVQKKDIKVETKTLAACFEDGCLVSLKGKNDKKEWLPRARSRGDAPLQLIYPGTEVMDINQLGFGEIETLQVSPDRAEVRLSGLHGDGIIGITTDPDTGDLIIEPAASTSRPGLRGVRWSITGISQDTEAVVPTSQGVKLPLSDPLIKGIRLPWPLLWEAGLVIIQGKGEGFWVHTRDTRYRPKTLQVGLPEDAQSVCFETEAYGPIDHNLSAGGLAWRINVFQGDWKVPAARYRDWLWQAYGLAGEEHKRADWFNDISLALSWCPDNIGMLKALAKKVPASRVLIHFPRYRAHNYDQDYPDYTPSAPGRKFVAQAREMGYHVMPHCNAMEIDPTHPEYDLVRDFQFRELESKRIMGWIWHRGLDSQLLPDSNTQLKRMQHKNVMAKIHPACSAWQHLLGKHILALARTLKLDAVFIDITLNTFNLYNALVENTSSPEGIRSLISHIAGLGRGLVVGGEGLNEITMQGQSFAQAHLFRSWELPARYWGIPGVHRALTASYRSAPARTRGLSKAGPCPLNAFMFGRLCRTFGYNGMAGRTPYEEMGMKVDRRRGVMPTLTVRTAEEITRPNRAVKQVLELAKS